MKQPLHRLRMTVDIDLRLNGTDPIDAEGVLRNGIKHLVDEGMITSNLDAELVRIKVGVRKRTSRINLPEHGTRPYPFLT